jgi:hypothetical protein
LSASSSIYDGVDSTALKLNFVFGGQYRIIDTLCVRLGVGPDIYTPYHLFIINDNAQWAKAKDEPVNITLQAGMFWSFKFIYIAANYKHFFRTNTPSFNVSTGFAL